MPNDQKKHAAGYGPGSTLAQARTDLGLNHQEVAERLHLAARQIVALEADDYDNLPGATYVRGYLRSYAELLGLSPGPILESYAQLSASQAPPTFATIAPKEQITSEHRQMKLATYVVAAVIAGLVITWWQSQDGSAPAPSATTDIGSPELLPPTVDSAPLSQSVPDLASVPAPPLGPPAMGTEQPGGSPIAGPTTSTSPLSTPALPVPKLPTIAPPPVPASTPATPATPAPVVSPAPEATEPPVPVGPRVRLVIHTDEESWIDVRDARQNKLLYETVPPGRSVSVEGPAPLSVFIGNVAGVRVEFNGQAYDATRHQRGQVARFTLGRELTEN